MAFKYRSDPLERDNRDANERRLSYLLKWGLTDQHDDHQPNPTSIRALRFSSLLADRLWAMIDRETTKVGLPVPAVDL